jgi:FkbM family methyltransferase
MRIALVANHLGVGGAERQAALWADACAKLGHSVTIAVLEELGREYELPGSVQVTHLGKSRWADLAIVVRRLRAAIRSSDLTVAFQTYPALCCALARTGKPWIVVAGNDPRHWRDTSRVPSRAFRWAFGRAALACAPTRGIAECHERLGVRPCGRWLVVPNIVDDRAFVVPAPAGAGREGVLFVGRLAPVKNPQLAMQAAGAAGAPLTIAGEGSLEQSLRSSLGDRGNGAAVDLRGYVERPWELYAQHRVLLVTSRYESFGNMIVESLAAGTPVVSADCDFGPRELIAEARFSHLSDPDPGRLAELLREVLARPYTEHERQECLEIASRYRRERVAPLIAAAIEEALRMAPLANAHDRLLMPKLASRLLGALPVGLGQRRIAKRIYSRRLRTRTGTVVRARLRCGAIFEIDVSDGIQASAFLMRSYDPELVGFLVDELPAKGVFFDVGAHVGLVSFSVASQAGDVRAHAFEPHPRNAEQFRRNKELNPNTEVTFNEVAVGTQQGYVTLGSAGGSTMHYVLPEDLDEEATDTRRVSVTTLDRYAREHGIDFVDVMKLDVEGYEIQVLEGASELLSAGRIGCIVTEIHARFLKRAGTDALTLVGRLEKLGYQRRELPPRGVHRFRKPREREYANVAFVRSPPLARNGGLFARRAP